MIKEHSAAFNTSTDTGVENFVPTPYEIGEIVDQGKRGWKVTLNGEEVETVNSLVISSERVGTSFIYGQRQEGYDGVIARERSGGGAVTVPYMIDENGQIFIGVVVESRPTVDELPIENVPRGVLEPGESHQKGAERETLEEMGFDAEVTPEDIERGREFKILSRFTLLAAGLNMNSALYDTRVESEGGGKAGISVFSVEVSKEALTEAYDEGGREMFVFKPELLQAPNLDKGTEKIYGSRFIPLEEAAASPDAFTAAATGLVVTALVTGKLSHPTLSAAYKKV